MFLEINDLIFMENHVAIRRLRTMIFIIYTQRSKKTLIYFDNLTNEVLKL